MPLCRLVALRLPATQYGRFCRPESPAESVRLIPDPAAGKRGLTGSADGPIFCNRFPPAEGGTGRDYFWRWAISIVYLVRHGETEWNQDGKIQGKTDIPLNARGRRQAEALARCLADVPLELIYTSDLSRARITAETIAARRPREIPVVAMPELRECDYGLWEGLTRPEAAGRFPDDWSDWIKRGGAGRPTGGEDVLSLAGRTGRVFEQAVGEGKTVLISAHRGSLRAILCHALGLDQTFRDRFFFANCSISALECRPEHGPNLLFLNDTCHLDGV
jgi:broad specificity phosphatase PhoE